MKKTNVRSHQRRSKSGRSSNVRQHTRTDPRRVPTQYGHIVYVGEHESWDYVVEQEKKAEMKVNKTTDEIQRLRRLRTSEAKWNKHTPRIRKLEAENDQNRKELAYWRREKNQTEMLEL